MTLYRIIVSDPKFPINTSPRCMPIPISSGTSPLEIIYSLTLAIAFCIFFACYAAGNVSGTGSGTIHVGGVVGENYATVTACYWSGLPDNDNGGATKVDGTNVTWQTAVAAMSAALSGKGWQYELKDGNSLPTLKKEQ